MRTAMQSQNLKVTTYTFFFRQCKKKSYRGVGTKTTRP